MIRLTNSEHSFWLDATNRITAAERLYSHGSDADRPLLARDLHQAGHALIAAADAIALRIADEAEEVARHG